MQSKGLGFSPRVSSDSACSHPLLPAVPVATPSPSASRFLDPAAVSAGVSGSSDGRFIPVSVNERFGQGRRASIQSFLMPLCDVPKELWVDGHFAPDASVVVDSPGAVVAGSVTIGGPSSPVAVGSIFARRGWSRLWRIREVNADETLGIVTADRREPRRFLPSVSRREIVSLRPETLTVKFIVRRAPDEADFSVNAVGSEITRGSCTMAPPTLTPAPTPLHSLFNGLNDSSFSEASITIEGLIEFNFPLRLNSMIQHIEGKPAIFDGTSTTSLFRLENTTELTLESITLQNGRSEASLEGGSTLVLLDAIVLNCRARDSGGAFEVVQSSYVFAIDSNFSSNRADGMGGGGVAYVVDSSTFTSATPLRQGITR